MSKSSLKAVSKIMKKLDLCMLTTVDGRGIPDARPMSNNHQVDYDGTSHFFAMSDTLMVKHIKKNPNVTISFIENKVFKKLFLVVNGKASLTTDREKMRDYWSKDLELWFKDGIDTKGLVMISVEASFIKGWKKGEEFEVDRRTSKAKAS